LQFCHVLAQKLKRWPRIKEFDDIRLYDTVTSVDKQSEADH